MTRTSRPPRILGLSLIEVMVAGALFGLFTSMVATALVMGHQVQNSSTGKLDAVRRATLALDRLVRDVEAARFRSKVTMGGATVAVAPTSPEGLNELLITRQALIPGDTYPSTVRVGYWIDHGTPEDPADGTVRRVQYQGYGALTPLPGETADGRILVRDVRDFLVSSEVSGPLTIIKAQLRVSTVGPAVKAAVATEAP